MLQGMSQFTAERRFKLWMGELLDNNNPEQITKDTPKELEEKILSDYENLLELCDIAEEFGLDLKEFRKEHDIDV